MRMTQEEWNAEIDRRDREDMEKAKAEAEALAEKKQKAAGIVSAIRRIIADEINNARDDRDPESMGDWRADEVLRDAIMELLP